MIMWLFLPVTVNSTFTRFEKTLISVVEVGGSLEGFVCCAMSRARPWGGPSDASQKSAIAAGSPAVRLTLILDVPSQKL